MRAVTEAARAARVARSSPPLPNLLVAPARDRINGRDGGNISRVAGDDFMPIENWDHLELWVGNAKQSAYFYEHAFGFTRTAYAGPETGVRDRASYVLEQGDVRLVLTSGLRGDSEITRFSCLHGDGVKDIALRVPSAENAYQQAVQRGARGVLEPHWVDDSYGRVELAGIATYGDTTHTFVNRSEYAGPYLPGYVSIAEDGVGRGVGLAAIDHVVGNVELGRMDEWVGFYERCLGFTEMLHFTDEAIHTEYSALMSKVMTGGEGKIKVPINEPADGRRKSQIEEYLEYFGGPGVQHVALATTDIVGTVEALRDRGIRFLETPDPYYEDLGERVGEIVEDYADLRRLRILADRDEDGYLLQVFTKTAQDRPTLFFEVIERHGARGFGEGNFKALFEAIEREQALRGNL
jgi:4-hydroxyphenylpyruvate dioxygenase